MLCHPKSTKDSFVLELKCVSIRLGNTHILKTRFELARKLYNTTLSYALKQVPIDERIEKNIANSYVCIEKQN